MSHVFPNWIRIPKKTKKQYDCLLSVCLLVYLSFTVCQGVCTCAQDLFVFGILPHGQTEKVKELKVAVKEKEKDRKRVMERNGE